jgi:hypothetical protein
VWKDCHFEQPEVPLPELMSGLSYLNFIVEVKDLTSCLNVLSRGRKLYMPMPLTNCSISKVFQKQHRLDLLRAIRRLLARWEINNLAIARTLCILIPNQCPFERTLTFWGRTLLHIPPLCKFNPFYEELVALCFRALSYLASQGIEVI